MVNPEGIQPDVSKNTYSVSTANILDSSTVGSALTWTIGDHLSHARAVGYDGIEVWPQRFAPLLQIETGSLSQVEKDGITSAHQSVGLSFKDAISGTAGSDSAREIKKAVFLPGQNQSLSPLEKLRDIVDRDIPVVLFQGLPEGYLESTKYSQKGIQTSPELAEEIGAENAQEFVEAVLEMGYTNVVIDTHHLRHPSVVTGNPSPFADWQESVPTLLPYTKEIHVGLGRLDFGGADESVVKQELWDFMTQGKNNTDIIQMLRYIADTGWKGLVVMELRPSSIKEVLNQKGLQLSAKNYSSALDSMRETLFQIFDK